MPIADRITGKAHILEAIDNIRSQEGGKVFYIYSVRLDPTRIGRQPAQGGSRKTSALKNKSPSGSKKIHIVVATKRKVTI